MYRHISSLGKYLMRVIIYFYIRGLDGNHQIAVIHIFYVFYISEGALGQSFGSDAPVFFQYIFFERTGIHSYSYRYLPGPRSLYHGSYPVRASDVPRIYAYLICSGFYGRYRQPVVEVNVRYQRHGGLSPHLRKDLRRFHIGNGDPYDLASGVLEPADLIQKSRLISRIHVGHGLDRARGASAYQHIFTSNLSRGSHPKILTTSLNVTYIIRANNSSMPAKWIVPSTF